MATRRGSSGDDGSRRDGEFHGPRGTILSTSIEGAAVSDEDSGFIPMRSPSLLLLEQTHYCAIRRVRADGWLAGDWMGFFITF